ncbi:MAG: TetR/AcrR family transcriptional regulator [Solirubrobacterales bacterium]|nr:TetR/AcrR family transcriptional regulator [Solirubrobacterales bacterium]
MSSIPATKQGRATRERIVRAAAELVGERGASATSLDDVIAATGASKSQLYHYFGDKHGLVQAVVDYQCATVLGLQAHALASVSDWDDLERWAQTMVAIVEDQGAHGGCPIGTLAAALSDTDERLRTSLSEAFQAWSDAIRGALLRLRDNGLISTGADLDALTTITLSAIQGGLLLSKTSRDAGQLRIALDGAIAQLRSGGTVADPTDRAPRPRAARSSTRAPVRSAETRAARPRKTPRR